MPTPTDPSADLAAKYLDILREMKDTYPEYTPRVVEILGEALAKDPNSEAANPADQVPAPPPSEPEP